MVADDKGNVEDSFSTLQLFSFSFLFITRVSLSEEEEGNFWHLLAPYVDDSYLV